MLRYRIESRGLFLASHEEFVAAIRHGVLFYQLGHRDVLVRDTQQGWTYPIEKVLAR